MATMARFNHSRQPAKYRASFRLFLVSLDGIVVVKDFASFSSLSAHLSSLFALGFVDTYFVRKLNF
jgi:hypothetical protein